MTSLKTELAQFTGTEQYYFNPLYPDLRYTDGTKYLAEKAGAYWLLDIIGTEYFPKQAEGVWDTMVVIKMAVANDQMQITVTDGDYNIYTERLIEFTDFPEGEWALWLVDGVLILPSEY